MDSAEIGMLKSDVRMLTAEVDRLEKRVRELEARWEREILGGLNGELAELRGTVSAQTKNHAELHELVLKRLLP